MRSGGVVEETAPLFFCTARAARASCLRARCIRIRIQPSKVGVCQVLVQQPRRTTMSNVVLLFRMSSTVSVYGYSLQRSVCVNSRNSHFPLFARRSRQHSQLYPYTDTVFRDRSVSIPGTTISHSEGGTGFGTDRGWRVCLPVRGGVSGPVDGSGDSANGGMRPRRSPSSCLPPSRRQRRESFAPPRGRTQSGAVEPARPAGMR